MLSGKRGPVLAAVVAIVVAILLLLFLVLPKMGQVSDAKKKLEGARSNQSTLESELSALQDAQSAAPQSQETIDKVNRLVPPTADLPGLILLLQNAATGSGIDLFTITPSTPVFDETTGLSTISVSISASGTYFTLTEYLYKIETLESRAAKVLSVNLSPNAASGDTSSPSLSMTATLSTFTADISAGPGSSPGPQTGGATGPAGPTS
jgi:Tfp pilus assembly protein PilO